MSEEETRLKLLERFKGKQPVHALSLEDTWFIDEVLKDERDKGFLSFIVSKTSSPWDKTFMYPIFIELATHGLYTKEDVLQALEKVNYKPLPVEVVNILEEALNEQQLQR